MTLYVNDKPIPNEDLQREIENLRPHYDELVRGDEPEGVTPEEQLAEWARENMIERTLLLQAAEREVEAPPAEAVDQVFQRFAAQHGGVETFVQRAGQPEDVLRAQLAERMRLDRFLEQLTQDATDPSEEEIEAHYDENPKRFSDPETIHAFHIVKHSGPDKDMAAAREDLEKVRKKFRNNASFEELAKQYSDCPDRGGDLGVFPRGQMVERFDEVAFNLEPGEISEIFETEFGLHVAMIREKTPATPRPFEEIQSRVTQDLMLKKRQEKINAFVDEEKKKAAIEEK